MAATEKLGQEYEVHWQAISEQAAPVHLTIHKMIRI